MRRAPSFWRGVVSPGYLQLMSASLSGFAARSDSLANNSLNEVEKGQQGRALAGIDQGSNERQRSGARVRVRVLDKVFVAAGSALRREGTEESRTAKVGSRELRWVLGEHLDLILGEADEGEHELLNERLDMRLKEGPGRLGLDAAVGTRISSSPFDRPYKKRTTLRKTQAGDASSCSNSTRLRRCARRDQSTP